MHPALWVSMTGLSAQDYNLSTSSNNLANIDTVGFQEKPGHLRGFVLPGVATARCQGG